MRIYILTIAIVCSCLIPTSLINAKTDYQAWDILEKSITEGWTQDIVKNILGLPFESYKDKEKSDVAVWVYRQKSSGNQEWTFRFDGSGKTIFVIYMPTSMTESEFTLEKIKSRWSKNNCEIKKKQTINPDFIKSVSYLSCDNEKRYVEYNRYNEVLLISVKK